MNASAADRPCPADRPRGRVIFVRDLHRLLDTVFAEAFKGSVRELDAAFFSGYRRSGIGRETHKSGIGREMMPDHYQQTKNVLVSYGTKALGFF